jgi:hypothetical protein
VDLATGVFMFTKTDLVVPGRLPMAITRTYRSGDAFTGRFGLGTTLGFDDLLQFPSSDVITYVYRGGARTPFARQADGTFTTSTVPAFRGARFTVNPDGTRTLRFKDGAALTFDANGLLSQVRDRAGNAAAVQRSALLYPLALQEPAGRALQLTWAGLTPDRVTLPESQQLLRLSPPWRDVVLRESCSPLGQPLAGPICTGPTRRY